jgi:hypothetical protein
MRECTKTKPLEKVGIRRWSVKQLPSLFDFKISLESSQFLKLEGFYCSSFMCCSEKLEILTFGGVFGFQSLEFSSSLLCTVNFLHISLGIVRLHGSKLTIQYGAADEETLS